jgi:hypothetical protein
MSKDYLQEIDEEIEERQKNISSGKKIFVIIVCCLFILISLKYILPKDIYAIVNTAFMFIWVFFLIYVGIKSKAHE